MSAAAVLSEPPADPWTAFFCACIEAASLIRQRRAQRGAEAIHQGDNRDGARDGQEVGAGDTARRADTNIILSVCPHVNPPSDTHRVRQQPTTKGIYANDR